MSYNPIKKYKKDSHSVFTEYKKRVPIRNANIRGGVPPTAAAQDAVRTEIIP
jgi:hypothetical protein